MGKKDVAAEVWRLMMECLQAQFGRASGVLQQLGLTPGHLKALMAIEPEEARPMGALAQVFGCDASTMTWLVDRLEERGLVERRSLPSDRRVKTVALTREGRAMKTRVQGMLYEPPPELLALDRSALEELRAVFTRLSRPSSIAR